MASNNKVASYHSPMASGGAQSDPHSVAVAVAEDSGRSSNNKAAANKPPPSGSSTEYQLRKYLLLLATLVATVTYVAGLNLPGGAWQDDTADGRHHVGDPILQYAHPHRYLALYYCNATAFAASLVVSLLLLVLDGKNTGWWEALLRVVMVLDLLGLMGAYAAGSCRDTFTTVYSALLVCAVFAYVVVAFTFYLFSGDGGGLARRLPRCFRKQSDVHVVAGGGSAGGGYERQELHEILMLLATFAVTITYVAGLNPPGGFWADDGGEDGAHHHMSDPVLQEHYSSRYQAFYVCNTTAFVASLLIIILLLDKKLTTKLSVRFVALYGLTVTALLGLMGAYAAGSCRQVDDTTYVICLIAGVLAYIFLQVAVTKAIAMKSRCSCFQVVHDFASKCLGAIRSCFVDGSLQQDQNQKQNDSRKDEAVEKARSLVMLLATLVVSITYQAGLDPPGGLWPDDRDGHRTGDPILLTTDPARYKVFFYSNSAAFVASLIVILMVQSRFLLRRHTLEAAMILDLFGLIGAYAAGSCRDGATSVHVVALAGLVLVYVVIHIVFFTLDHRDNHRDADKLENRREVLLLLAILAATLTYQAGLTPPGGFWSESDADGHRAGYPVLHDHYRPRYRAFFYCNAASFMASVALIVLLVNPNLYRPGIRCYALYVCTVVGMFGLMGAYAAGSSRDLRTSIYVLTLVVAVFAFVALEVAIFWVCPYLKQHWKQWRCSSKNADASSRKAESEAGDGLKQNQETEIQDPSKTHEGMAEAEEQEKRSHVSGSSGGEERNMREYLMLLGVLAASVTYQTGLKPPGGLWQDNSDGHSAGSSILHYINKRRYHAFFYSNSTSFMASVVVIILLLPWTKLPLWPMHTAILLDMLGLLGAYAAGSTRDWETSRNVIFLIIPVLAYIAAYAAVSIFRKRRWCHRTREQV